MIIGGLVETGMCKQLSCFELHTCIHKIFNPSNYMYYKGFVLSNEDFNF